MERRKIDASATRFASTGSGVTLVASVAVGVGGATLKALRYLGGVAVFDLPFLKYRI